MIERVIAWSARNKMIVLLLTAAAVGFAVHALYRVPLDAIPDLSDTQVIVYSRWDRSPDLIEDQVTYPITTALLGAPNVKAIRGYSDFGYSFVYVIFEDGTDLYWARSRVLEYLSKILPRLPEGVRTEIGPDATGVGWVYQYALVDRTGKHDYLPGLDLGRIGQIVDFRQELHGNPVAFGDPPQGFLGFDHIFMIVGDGNQNNLAWLQIDFDIQFVVRGDRLPSNAEFPANFAQSIGFLDLVRQILDIFGPWQGRCRLWRDQDIG